MMLEVLVAEAQVGSGPRLLPVDFTTSGPAGSVCGSAGLAPSLPEFLCSFKSPEAHKDPVFLL